MRTLQMKISPQSMGTCSEETELKRRFISMRVRKDRAVCRGRAGVLPVRMAVSIAGAVLMVCPAYCDIDGNSSMQKFLKTMFSITVFAGIVLIAAGAASLIRTIVSMASGEQAQPGALGKGIGLIVGGAVLCALKAIVTSIIGQDPTTMNFY